MDIFKMLNGIDLFSGIGGITLALKEWVKPIVYCEIDPYCQSVLLSRMQKGDLPKAPIWDDIRTLSHRNLKKSLAYNEFDIITGGFPCQDISVARYGKGLAGKRSGLFFEIVRLAKEIQPTFIFLENVPAITTRGGLEVVKEIAALGYDCRWCVISASSVGALHRRERWFLLAHSTSKGADGYTCGKEKAYTMPRIIGKDDSYTDSITSKQTDSSTFTFASNEQSWRGHSRFYWPFKSRDDWQKTVSQMGKCSDGLPYHVDRLRALGNAVVPQQVKWAYKYLVGFDI